MKTNELTVAECKAFMEAMNLPKECRTVEVSGVIKDIYTLGAAKNVKRGPHFEVEQELNNLRFICNTIYYIKEALTYGDQMVDRGHLDIVLSALGDQFDRELKSISTKLMLQNDI